MTEREEHIYLLASAKTRTVIACDLLRETVRDLQIVVDGEMETPGPTPVLPAGSEALDFAREALRKAWAAQIEIFAAFEALKEPS